MLAASPGADRHRAAMSPYPTMVTVLPWSMPTGARIRPSACAARIAPTRLANHMNAKMDHSPRLALNAALRVCEWRGGGADLGVLEDVLDAGGAG